MSNPLENKHILLGITGSIAAYKGAELASKLAQAGVDVNVLLTASAEKFVSPLTFQSLTGKPCFTDADLWGGEGHIVHVQLSRKTDLMLIAPASANTIAKLAHGIADNLVSITALAARCAMVIVPAMDAGMFTHPATQENVKILQSRGVTFIGPEEGHLASGLEGRGRMTEPQEIVNQVRWILSQGGVLSGRKIVVTAGGTQEAIDPVRVIGNHSSGKQGYAIAQAALDFGAKVTLITTPTALPIPFGAQVERVQTAEEMRTAVLANIPEALALIMTAAVADFRPIHQQEEKIKKEKGLKEIQLENTRDILLEVANKKPKINPGLRVIGFAAESQDIFKNAQKKLESKHLDIIAVNDITSPMGGFGLDTNKVSLLFANGSSEDLPLMKKSEVAEKIILTLINWLAE
jgi:phosphopantothenoylcysteine decarboxylase/phosphopantothenate--cysteine ligase